MTPHRVIPLDVAEHLAPEVDLTAWHEAGHAVAYVAAGLPLHSVYVRIDSRWRAGRQWKVSGSTRITAGRRGMPVPDSQREWFAVAALAGPEAEARRLHEVSGMTLRDARREADEAGGRDDLADAAEDLKFSAYMTMASARKSTIALVRRMWPVIGQVAALLEPGRVVPGAVVREIVEPVMQAVA
jgi:hypothetical protein